MRITAIHPDAAVPVRRTAKTVVVKWDEDAEAVYLQVPDLLEDHEVPRLAGEEEGPEAVCLEPLTRDAAHRASREGLCRVTWPEAAPGGVTGRPGRAGRRGAAQGIVQSGIGSRTAGGSEGRICGFDVYGPYAVVTGHDSGSGDTGRWLRLYQLPWISPFFRMLSWQGHSGQRQLVRDQSLPKNTPLSCTIG